MTEPFGYTPAQQQLAAAAPELVPKLAELLRRLMIECEQVLTGVHVHRDDSFGFLTICFLARQIEHAQAVQALGEHPDSGLVARTMMEGVWLLKWTALKPVERAERWRAFAYVHDWRLMRERDAVGRDVDPGHREIVARGLAQFGERFHTKEARQARAARQDVPDDPYERNWYSLQLRQLAEAADELTLYKEAYGFMSERQHWHVASIGTALEWEGERFNYNGSSPLVRGAAVTSCFESLFKTVAIAHQHLRGDVWKRLDVFAAAYKALAP